MSAEAGGGRHRGGMQQTIGGLADHIPPNRHTLLTQSLSHTHTQAHTGRQDSLQEEGSSEPSAQSGPPSQCQWAGIQRPLEQRNSLWEQVEVAGGRRKEGRAGRKRKNR